MKQHLSDSITVSPQLQKYTSSIFLAAVCFMYSFMMLLAEMKIVNRPAASLILIMGLYLVLRPSSIIHPATLVFVNYLIYFVMPYFLFTIYDIFKIEYILPWGLINDWSKLSTTAIVHFELTFVLFYTSLLYCTDVVIEKLSFASLDPESNTTYSVSIKGTFVLTFIMLVGVIMFIVLTGGPKAWLTNYDNTYLNSKAGLGVINILLIYLAHLLAFIAGWMKWRSKEKYPLVLWVLMITVLVLCIYFQGIKSRVPLVLFFFLMPKLTTIDIKLRKAFIIFLALIVFFMVSMYFRSNGFYSTPGMALEYLQSYFNTIFLHDLTLSNYTQGETTSMFMGLKKYTEIFVGKIPRENYDLSVALTQRFYPDDWYIGGATQQWPIETDFFLTFPTPFFWFIPIFTYSFIMAFLYKLTTSGVPVIMFIYAAEFLRIMSIFRSSLLTWDAFIQFIFYGLVLISCTTLIFRKNVP